MEEGGSALSEGRGKPVTLFLAFLPFYQKESSMRRGAREKHQAFVSGGQGRRSS